MQDTGLWKLDRNTGRSTGRVACLTESSMTKVPHHATVQYRPAETKFLSQCLLLWSVAWSGPEGDLAHPLRKRAETRSSRLFWLRSNYVSVGFRDANPFFVFTESILQ